MAGLQDLRALPKSQQAALVGGGFLLLAVVIGWWAWGGLGELGSDPDVPAFIRAESTPESLFGQIDAEQQRIDKAQRVIAEHEGIKQRLAALEGEIEAASGLLPEVKNKDDLREMFGQYAREVPAGYGPVAIERINFTDRIMGDRRGARGAAAAPQQGPQISAIVSQCELACGMEGLIAWINAVETSTDRFMVVENIAITPGAVGVDSELFEIDYEQHTAVVDVVSYIYEEGLP